MVRRRTWPGSSNRTDHAAHSGLRQVQPNRRHVLPRRLRLRRRSRPLHLPRGQRAGPVPPHLRHSQHRRHSRGHKALSRQQIGLRRLRTQSPVLPERSCPQDPAGSDEDARDVARALAATPRIRGGLSPSEESRDAVRPSQAHPAPHALAAEGSERRKRRVPARRDRPKPETTRPPKTDQYASGNVGRITPRMEAQEPLEEPFQPLPKHCELPHQTEHLTAFSTISALP